MKVVFFTKYTRSGASSRLRTYQYLDYFRSRSLECHVYPLFDDKYLEEVYRYKRHNKWLAFRGFIKRMGVLLTLKATDKVIIEKELFPYFPPIFEWLLYLKGVRYIADYDDAIFHNYDVSPNLIIRTFLANKISTVVRLSSLVVAGNDYLKEKALLFGAQKVTVIPTVIDLARYAPKRRSQPAFTIGWIGSPITFKYLGRLREVFIRLSTRHQFQVVYVGSKTTLGLPFERCIPWTEEDEVDHIATFDVGIMPLEDNVWERGKCGYKLIQYMGCGIPVIGTPLGVNKRLIIDGFNGYQATSLDEWEQSLEKIIRNSTEENYRLGMNGRHFVEHHYSLNVYKEKWLEVLCSGIRERA